MTVEQCTNVGDLQVGGKTVGRIRCTEPERHSGDHSAFLSWATDAAVLEAIDWPDALDPDEPVDVEVPLFPNAQQPVQPTGEPEPDLGVAVCGDEYVIAHDGALYCDRPAGHPGQHTEYSGGFVAVWDRSDDGA